MKESLSPGCCGDLFADFQFEDLRNAAPPKKKGVYVVRIKAEGSKLDQVIKAATGLVQKLNWGLVEEFVLSRVNRLKRISSCRVIYIGSAGSMEDSENTLQHLYSELACRHTVMFSLWCLLYFGWKLEYGWKIGENAGKLEGELKSRYRLLHKATLPALVEK